MNVNIKKKKSLVRKCYKCYSPSSQQDPYPEKQTENRFCPRSVPLLWFEEMERPDEDGALLDGD